MVARWVALVLFSTLAHSAPSSTLQIDRYFEHLKSRPVARHQFLKAMLVVYNSIVNTFGEMILLGQGQELPAKAGNSFSALQAVCLR